MRTTVLIIAVILMVTPSVITGQNDGSKIYADKCSSCHAKDGSGNSTRGKAMKAPDLRSPEIAKKTDKQLIDGFSKPAAHRGMKKQLGVENLRLVVTHLRGFKK
jgi:mono/diheme cytochrome c family protein